MAYGTSPYFKAGDFVSGCQVAVADSFNLLPTTGIPAGSGFVLTSLIIRNTHNRVTTIMIGDQDGPSSYHDTRYYHDITAVDTLLKLVFDTGLAFQAGAMPGFRLNPPTANDLDVIWCGHFVPAA